MTRSSMRRSNLTVHADRVHHMGQEEDVHRREPLDLFHRRRRQYQPEASTPLVRLQGRRAMGPMPHQPGPAMVRQRHSQMAPSCHPAQAGVAPVSTEAGAAGQVHPEETATAPEAAMVVMDHQVI